MSGFCSMFSQLLRPFPAFGDINHYLRPSAISVLAAESVDDDFDARLSAVGRVYLYRILNRRAPPALERGRVWHVAPPLDPDAIPHRKPA